MENVSKDISKDGAVHTVLSVFGCATICLVPTIVFTGLFFYKFRGSHGATLVHLQLMIASSLFLSFSCAIIMSQFGKIRFFNIASSAIVSLWCLAISSLYVLFVVGLVSWNKVPTLELFSVYIAQIGGLINTLEMPLWLVIILATTLPILIFSSYFLILRYVISRMLVFPVRSSLGMSCAMLFTISFSWAQSAWINLLVYRQSTSADEPLHSFFNSSTKLMGESAIIAILGTLGDPNRSKIERKIVSNYKPTVLERPKNVIIIIVDALRPDHLGINGYARNTTPFLDAEKSAGRIFSVKEARSGCAESTCGILGLLTGKQPHELNDSNFGLPEVLARHGYKRIFILGGDHTNFYGLRATYGAVETYFDGTTSGRYINDDYGLLSQVEALPGAKNGQPYFIYLHLMSVHGLGKRHTEHVIFTPQRSLYFPGTVTSEDNFEEVTNFYDNGVHQMDDVIRRLFITLRAKKYMNDDTLTLITSDHGESIGQHGIATHAQSLFEPVIRIAWVWYRNSGHYDLASPTLQSDFAPTIAAMLGVTAPANWSGINQFAPNRRTLSFHVQAPEAAVIFYDGDSRKIIHNFDTGFTSVFFPNSEPEEKLRALTTEDKPYVERAMQLLSEKGYQSIGREANNKY